MADRQELLQLIRLGKKMDRDVACKIYGYAVTRPEFEEEALSLMERLHILYADPGDRNPRELYRQIMDEYRRRRDEELKPVARWLREESEKKFENMCRERQKEGEERRRRDLIQKKRQLLIHKRQILTQRSPQLTGSLPE